MPDVKDGEYESGSSSGSSSSDGEVEEGEVEEAAPAPESRRVEVVGAAAPAGVSKFVSTADGARLHYVVRGHKEKAILFIHGW